ncbi:MAG: hypothetical protein R6U50_05220 [Desulfobacterales bacterium]
MPGEMIMLCSLSNLKETDVKNITELEKALGKTLLAYSCHDIQLAELNEEELNRIKNLEQKMGISLVALNV